jgi:hypothetical protein
MTTAAKVAGWTEVGIDYCLEHHGTRNEDEVRCDWQDRTDPEHRCQVCEGHGYLVDPVGDPHDCVDCDDGLTPCNLQPLGYIAEPGQ